MTDTNTIHISACPTCGGAAQVIAPEPYTYRHVDPWRGLLVEADSYLSLIRHRHLDRQYATSSDGQRVVREIDDVIRRLREAGRSTR